MMRPGRALEFVGHKQAPCRAAVAGGVTQVLTWWPARTSFGPKWEFVLLGLGRSRGLSDLGYVQTFSIGQTDV